MTHERIANRKPKMPPVHPGQILRLEVLPALGLSITEAPRRMGVSRQTLHRIRAGNSGITPEMAPRIGKFCGNGPELWLRMQEAYDVRTAEKKLRKNLERIPAWGWLQSAQ